MLWGLMALLSIGTALASLRFLFVPADALYGEAARQASAGAATIDAHFAFLLQERYLRFAAHFVAGPLVLLIGPFQFLDGLRARRPGLHRGLGWIYAVGVAVAGGAGFVLALGSWGGLSTHVGFAMLAVLWLWCTGAAVWHARAGRYAVHRQRMTRSFALTFAAVTLRAILPLAALGVPMEEVYQTAAWASWVPNLLVAEWILRRHRGALA
jgi:uncharacterized membrane protein